MFYNYNKRMDELVKISKIPFKCLKKTALNHFIKKENEILASLDIPTSRSQALDLARLLLRAIGEFEESNQVQSGEYLRK